MFGVDAVVRDRGVADQHIGLAARVAEDIHADTDARGLVVVERTVVDPQQFGSVGPQTAAVVCRRRLGRIVGNHAVVEQRLGSGVDTDGAHADVRILDDLAVEDVHRRVADENARAVTLVELHAAYRRAAHRSELRRTVLDRESVERSLHAVHLGRRHRNHVAYGVVAVQNRLVRHGIGHGALGRIRRSSRSCCGFRTCCPARSSCPSAEPKARRNPQPHGSRRRSSPGRSRWPAWSPSPMSGRPCRPSRRS